jgi:hypothetical protein
MIMADQAEQYKISEFDDSSYNGDFSAERIGSAAVMAAMMMSTDQRLVFLGLVTGTGHIRMADWLFDFDDHGTVYVQNAFDRAEEYVINYFGTPARRDDEKAVERLESQVQEALGQITRGEDLEPASEEAILRATKEEL